MVLYHSGTHCQSQFGLTVSSLNPSYYDVLAWKPCAVIEGQSCVDLVPHVSFDVLFEYQKVTRHLGSTEKTLTNH